MFNLLHLDHLLLLQHLDSIVSLVVLRLHKVYTTEGAGSECSLDLEVCEGIFALRLAGRSFVHSPVGRVD